MATALARRSRVAPSGPFSIAPGPEFPALGPTSVGAAVRAAARAVGLARPAGALGVGLAVVPALPGSLAARVGRAVSFDRVDAGAAAIAHPSDHNVVVVARARVQARAAGIPRLATATGTGTVAESVGEARRRRIDVTRRDAVRPLSI